MCGKAVEASHLARFDSKVQKGDIVFLRSKFRGKDRPILGRSAAEWLLDKNVKCVGTNDESIIFGRTAHEILLKKEVPLIECLVNLDLLSKDRVFVVALLLKVIGIGGSPARVIAIEE